MMLYHNAPNYFALCCVALRGIALCIVGSQHSQRRSYSHITNHPTPISSFPLTHQHSPHTPHLSHHSFQFLSSISLPLYSSIQPADVIIVGGFGGRLDQEVANIHALFKWHSPSRRLVLVGKLRNNT